MTSEDFRSFFNNRIQSLEKDKSTPCKTSKDFT